jgi:hypothetical protein
LLISLNRNFVPKGVVFWTLIRGPSPALFGLFAHRERLAVHARHRPGRNQPGQRPLREPAAQRSRHGSLSGVLLRLGRMVKPPIEPFQCAGLGCIGARTSGSDERDEAGSWLSKRMRWLFPSMRASLRYRLGAGSLRAMTRGEKAVPGEARGGRQEDNFQAAAATTDALQAILRLARGFFGGSRLFSRLINPSQVE